MPIFFRAQPFMPAGAGLLLLPEPRPAETGSGPGQQKVEYRRRSVYDVPPLNKKMTWRRT
jgi:hypothetical protein